MTDKDIVHRLQNLIEIDDAYVRDKRTGKRGRSATGKSGYWLL